jgi:hypothetical protein
LFSLSGAWRLLYSSVKKVNAKGKKFDKKKFLLNTGGYENVREGIVFSAEKYKVVSR